MNDWPAPPPTTEPDYAAILRGVPTRFLYRELAERAPIDPLPTAEQVHGWLMRNRPGHWGIAEVLAAVEALFGRRPAVVSRSGPWRRSPTDPWMVGPAPEGMAVEFLDDEDDDGYRR